MSEPTGPRINPPTYDELRELAKRQSGSIERLNNALVATQRRIRTILTSFPLGLIVLGEGSRIEAVNNQVQDIFQYLPEELAGNDLDFLFPEIGTVEVNPKPVRVKARRKNGEFFPVEIYVNEFEAGEQRRIFVHLQDITERHRLEQLRQDLVAMVSHDLRTPLTSIRGTLTMVDEGVYGELNGSGKRAIARAQQSADYLISLVRDLLDAEKIESGSLEMDLVETTVGKVVQLTSHAIQVVAKESSVRVESDYTNDAFVADEDRIAQVLINLASNAIKYSPEGGTVRITAGLEGTNVKFYVTDQGPGIPLHMQSRIFERYQQLSQPKEKQRKGFGLGLAICKALVVMHGGSIWVESTVGKGSTFCVSIPMSPS